MRILPLTLLLTACIGRPITDSEIAFNRALQGETAVTEARISEGLIALPPREIATRPRITCQERLWPAPTTPTVRVSALATTVFNTVHLRENVYAEDFLPSYPDEIYLPAAMLFAHEMVHVWQWQNREITGYHPLRAAWEHTGGRDPYLFDPDTEASFLSFGYEQQGSIMEEYVCCRTLAPASDRTSRLHDMLTDVFDLPPLTEPLAASVRLPYPDIDTSAICEPPEV